MEYLYLFLLITVLFIIEFFLFSKRKNELLVQICRYILVNIVLIVLYLLLKRYFECYIIVLILLILKSFLDIKYVFKEIKFEVTNWEKYYSKKVLKIIEKKRKININYIVSILKEYNFNGRNVVEYGGGNSKVAEVISKEFNIKKFSIVDSNKYGIKLLDKRDIDFLDKNCISIFDFKSKSDYDLAYSVGLIEHFQNEDLIKCIDSHFKYVKKNKYVLFTFPVPSFRYKIVRLVYEIFNIWEFTDEVPLDPEYVKEIISKNNEVIHCSINTKLILPQAIVLAKRKK